MHVSVEVGIGSGSNGQLPVYRIYPFPATSYQSWHTPVTNTKDYVDAMTSARKLAADITDIINYQREKLGGNKVTVFAYRYTLCV